MAKAEILIPLRITVVDPPAGVLFAIQKGKSEVVTPILANGSDLSFDFSIRVQERADGSPNFLGPFVQGPTSARFVLSLIHISEPTRLLSISYAVFCLKKKK